MILPIVKYGDPVLQKEGEEVNNIDGNLAEFIQNMFETMYEAKGCGLAGPQVALSKKLFVMDVSSGKETKDRIVCINPQIVETKGAIVSEEGCLSFPESILKSNVRKSSPSRPLTSTARNSPSKLTGWRRAACCTKPTTSMAKSLSNTSIRSSAT